jgi:hypothetical protein
MEHSWEAEQRARRAIALGALVWLPGGRRGLRAVP